MKQLSGAAAFGIKLTVICFAALFAAAAAFLLLPEKVIPALVAVPLAEKAADTALRVLVFGVMSSLISDVYINYRNTL